MPTLDEFLMTGHLGALSVGMSLDDVRELLGEPEAIMTQRNPRLVKYGALQLVFSKMAEGEEPSLVSINLYFHNPDDILPKALALTGWMPSGETTYEEFHAHLDQLGISVDGGVHSGPSRPLILKSSVHANFHDDGQLYSLGITARRDQVELKQLSISISKSDLDTIRREASSHGVSISKLCSMWINERVSNLQPH